MEIHAAQGNIVDFEADAIVNAANRTLLGGGGVDGAIHAAAGPELLEACRQLGGCDTGDAKTTPGFALTARWIIHTVGPIWRGGEQGEPDLLASCYRRCIEEASVVGARTIAFPAISTGAYGYPPVAAATVAIRTLAATSSDLSRVTLVAFDTDTLTTYRDLLNTLR